MRKVREVGQVRLVIQVRHVRQVTTARWSISSYR